MKKKVHSQKTNSDKTFKLCYVEHNWAYFTTQELSKQWGDDWDDAPYEHNAGSPYGPNESYSYMDRDSENRPKLDSEGQTVWLKGSDYVDGVPKWEIKKVAFDGWLETPASLHGINSPFSVEMINAGAAAWLVDKYGSSGVVIPAGTTLEEFRILVKKVGGQVYE